MNDMRPRRFTELSREPIGTNKFVVVSKREDDKYSIAQQVEANTDSGVVRMFLKNAIIVSRDGLEGVFNAVKQALEKDSGEDS